MWKSILDTLRTAVLALVLVLFVMCVLQRDKKPYSSFITMAKNIYHQRWQK